LSTAQTTALDRLLRGLLVAIAAFVFTVLVFGLFGNVGPYELALIVAITAALTTFCVRR
jgi:CBS domain containing-hemolysin-like protein